MIIEFLCGFPHYLVMGASSLVGAIAYAGYSIYHKKKELKTQFVFDWKRVSDTVWQSVLAGVGAGLALGCGWVGVLVAMVTGVGVDKITNKLKVGEKEVLNFVQLIANFISSRDR